MKQLSRYSEPTQVAIYYCTSGLGRLRLQTKREKKLELNAQIKGYKKAKALLSKIKQSLDVVLC
jgi:hypothetical protein